MGGPGDDVHGCGVEGEIEYFCPGGARTGGGFAPDEDFAVVGCGGEDVAVFWMRPGDGPDCSFVAVCIVLVMRARRWAIARRGKRRNKPFESFGQSVGFAFDFEDFDCSV